MKCTRVLHAFGSHPQPAVMPVDLARCWSLSQQQPLHQLLSMPQLKATQRCGPPRAIPCPPRLSSSSSSSSSSSPASSLPSSPLEPRSCFRRDSSNSVGKKQVIFADAKGLALTVVHLFRPDHCFFSSNTLEVKSPPTKPQGLGSTKLQRHRFRLGFPQPTQDVHAFLARLRETHIQLESCSVSENSLSGKVCVSHVSNDKSVHVTVTSDSWRSRRDVPCTFLQKLRLAGSEVDVYSFDLSLPQNADPKERVEFCLSLRPGLGATPHWDNNRGLNYRVCLEKDGAAHGDAGHYYPTLPKARQRPWSSQVQNAAELTYCQRSLSNRVKAEWSSLCSTKYQ